MSEKKKSTHQSSVLSRSMVEAYDSGMTVPQLSNKFRETEGSIRRRIRRHFEYIGRSIPDDIKHVGASITQISKQQYAKVKKDVH